MYEMCLCGVNERNISIASRISCQSLCNVYIFAAPIFVYTNGYNAMLLLHCGECVHQRTARARRPPVKWMEMQMCESAS